MAPERTAPRLLLDQRNRMRDGVELSADVYLPPTGDGPWPAILQRTPYDNMLGGSGDRWPVLAVHFARHGYAFVSQDVRGRGDSDGRFIPFLNEAKDGYDTVEWTAEQPWCTGKVGMMGGSYGGLVQWLAAKERPPHLTALVSSSAAGRWMEELPYQSGVFRSHWIDWLNHVGGRTLQTAAFEDAETPDWERIVTHVPARDMDIALGRTNTAWRDWLKHNTFDDYWRQISLIGRWHEINLPVLHITGWFDSTQRGEIFLWRGMVAESPAADRQWLLCGPWDHAGTRLPAQQIRGRDFGPSALTDIRAVHLRFFDRWLKGLQNGQERDARVRYFVMGRNEWRDASTWPLPETIETRFYLHSAGSANSEAGNGSLDREEPGADEPSDVYTYDPDQPTPSHPDISKWLPPPKPFDNRWQLERDDVLLYTSEPLTEDVEITGHPFVVIYAASDCPDTDWFAGLCDVLPSGESEELTTGCMRAAYREGLGAQPSPIDPGKVYEYRLELRAISNVFKKGHRIRVGIASASYPEHLRNPNSNAPTGDDEVVRVARNTVCHTPDHPSHLLAPVVTH